MQEPNLTVPAIASQERLTIGYLSRLLRLPSLAPDIVTAIIDGKHPPELSAKRLMRLALKLPTDWAEQRKLLGFQENSAFPARVPRDAFLSSQPKMLTPKCPPRDFRVSARENSTKNRLCRWDPNLRGRNGAGIRALFHGVAKDRKYFYINDLVLAGALGFEPRITGPKPVALPLGHAPISVSVMRPLSGCFGRRRAADTH